MATTLPPYRDLGAYPIQSVQDPNGANPFGPNTYCTALVTADTTFHTNIPLTEIYHIWISSSPGTAFQVFKNQFQWDYVLVGNNAWDPSIPMPVRSGDMIWFYFNQEYLAAGSNPELVVYLREPLSYAS
jgi:hypothetical protein